MAMLTIKMLGNIDIKYNGELIESKISGKGIALICYLLINMGKKISRGKIATYLWEDSSEDASKYNFRYTLWNIKRIIPPDNYGNDFIITEKEFCFINKNYDFECDILLLNESTKGNINSLEYLLYQKKYYTGDFLEGFYLMKCPEFNDLVLFERIVYQNRYIELLKQILGNYLDGKQYSESIEVLNELLIYEPYSEEFVYMMMNTYKHLGNRAHAIWIFKQFEHKLEHNMNIHPSNQLKAFHKSLMNSDSSFKPNGEIKLPDKNKKLITVKAFCIADIQFFHISDILGKILDLTSEEVLDNFDDFYIMDLASIQKKVLSKFDGQTKLLDNPPSVRVINAFYEFIKHFCEMHILVIEIINNAEMDAASKGTLEYIKYQKVSGLTIKNCDEDKC